MTTAMTTTADLTRDAVAPATAAFLERLRAHSRSYHSAHPFHVRMNEGNGTGADIVGLCDGPRTVAGIVDELRTRYERPVDDEVRDFLVRMVARRHVTVEEAT